MPDPVDDATISDDAILWRRVPPYHVVFDERLGRIRPTSAAFEDHPNGSPMSVVLAEDVIAAGRTAHDVLQGHAGFSLAAISAGDVRKKSQIVVRAPVDGEPAHAHVVGNKTGSVRKVLAKEAQWVIPPAGDPDDE